MKVQVLQHVEFEGLGSIGTWLEAKGADIGYSSFFHAEPLIPDVKGIDMLVAMGGPMSVNDEHEFPWLREEKQFIRDAVDRGVPVLGVCLGAQLIANALGARVYKNPLKEIGWFPIQAAAASDSVFRFPSEHLVFHWHGETFDLPDGGVRLARSAACENQAFQFKSRVIGLQFHLEMTPDSACAIIDNCRHELVPGPFVQGEADLRAASPDAYASTNALMGDVLSYLTR